MLPICAKSTESLDNIGEEMLNAVIMEIKCYS